jgi:hypothetical protein
VTEMVETKSLLIKFHDHTLLDNKG